MRMTTRYPLVVNAGYVCHEDRAFQAGWESGYNWVAPSANDPQRSIVAEVPDVREEVELPEENG